MSNAANAVVPYADLERLAGAMVESNLFGIKTKAQAIALMAIANAEGKHPALAAQEYHIIQNRPALKADAMLARFQNAGGVVEWIEYTDAKVSGRFSHPTASPKPVLIEWTFAQAQKIGLAGKDNWKHYPRAMLRARVISEGVRTAYPGIAVGTYTVEEAQDMGAERDMGAAQVISGPVDADAFIAEVESALTRDLLQAVWKRAAAACKESADTEAHSRIKTAVTARLAELSKAEEI